MGRDPLFKNQKLRHLILCMWREGSKYKKAVIDFTGKNNQQSIFNTDT
jgi:hypothetical protein